MPNSDEEWVHLYQDMIPEGSFIVTSLVQNAEGTKILLDDEEHSVEIFFDGVPAMLRQANELLRMRTWRETQIKYQNDFFFRNHFFFRVDNSTLVKWVAEESCNFFVDDNLRHYCIVTSEEVIDILATFTPMVSVSKLQNPGD